MRLIAVGASACALAILLALLWRIQRDAFLPADASSPAASPPAPTAQATPIPQPAPAAAAPDDEALEEARRSVDADPKSALAQLEEDARRFPRSPHADERSYLRMRVLVNLQEIAAARAEAESFFERFPHSPWASRAFELTGVHPRPPLGPHR
jgi:hypothetical protein